VVPVLIPRFSEPYHIVAAGEIGGRVDDHSAQYVCLPPISYLIEELAAIEIQLVSQQYLC
jgi:hypothetical protein